MGSNPGYLLKYFLLYYLKANKYKTKEKNIRSKAKGSELEILETLSINILLIEDL